MLKKLKNYEKITNIILNVLIALLGIVFLISVYTGIQVRLLKHKHASFFGYTLFEVQTNSMGKAIKAGDWIIVKITQKAELKDIVTYESKGEFITHRVVGTYNGTYVTKGDANSGKDEPVDQSQLVGKVVKVIRGFGIVKKTVLNPAVLITLIITLFLLNSIMKKEKEKSKLTLKIEKKIKNLLKKLKINAKVVTAIKSFLKESILKLKETVKKIQNRLKKEKKVIEKEIEESKIITNTVNSNKVNDSHFEEMIEIIDLSDILDGVNTLKTNLGIEPEMEKEDELEKTMFFRMVPVNLKELDQTRLEIAKTELSEQAIKLKEQTEEESDEIEDDGLTKIDLELIEEKSKKNKNLIDAMMNIKKEEINNIILVLTNNEKLQANEATIKNTFMSAYVHARYYNYYNEKDIEYNGKNLATKISKIIKLITPELIDKYRGNDKKYKEKVLVYNNLFCLISNIDTAKDLISETKVKKEFYKAEIIKYYPECENEKIQSIINEILRIQKSFEEITQYFFKKLETNMFYLELSKLISKKDWFATDLKHNINFNKIYSDHIIDKTYTEGVVAEDKMSVLFTLLSSELIKNMLETDFKKKYIVYLPNTLYKKEKKIWRFLKMIEDEYAKSHVMILLTLNDLVQNKHIIKRLRKSGFRFVLAFDNNSRLQKRDLTNLYIMDKIFVGKNLENFENIISFIPESLNDNIVQEDIISKISSIEGGSE